MIQNIALSYNDRPCRDGFFIYTRELHFDVRWFFKYWVILRTDIPMFRRYHDTGEITVLAPIHSQRMSISILRTRLGLGVYLMASRCLVHLELLLFFCPHRFNLSPKDHNISGYYQERECLAKDYFAFDNKKISA